MSDDFSPSDEAAGCFLGTSAGVPGLGVYWSESYSYEVYRLNGAGEQWFPQPFNVLTVAADAAWAFIHDMILHPLWPWSPYR
jgi:hypothetical protein